MDTSFDTDSLAEPEQELYNSQVIHHLGLVASMIDQLGPVRIHEGVVG